MIPPHIANPIRATSKLGTEDALRHAICRLLMMGHPHDLEVAVILQDIAQQRGCEHLDTGPNDTGMLVDAIDVIVFG